MMLVLGSHSDLTEPTLLITPNVSQKFFTLNPVKDFHRFYSQCVSIFFWNKSQRVQQMVNNCLSCHLLWPFNRFYFVFFKKKKKSCILIFGSDDKIMTQKYKTSHLQSGTRGRA